MVPREKSPLVPVLDERASGLKEIYGVRISDYAFYKLTDILLNMGFLMALEYKKSVFHKTDISIGGI